MMKICLVNVSDVDEAMRSLLRVWRNSEKVSPFFLLDQVTEEQHRAWLERNVRGEDARACVIYADQVPLGLVYLPWFDRNMRCGEIGIYLYDRAFRELRPASAAYAGMMELAAGELGLERYMPGFWRTMRLPCVFMSAWVLSVFRKRTRCA